MHTTTFRLALLASLALGAVAAQGQVTTTTYPLTASAGTFTPVSAAATVLPNMVYNTNGGTTNYVGLMSPAQPIGFSFTFGGVAYTQFAASPHGFLTFNVAGAATATASTQRVNALAATTNDGIKPLVAPFWSNLSGDNTGTAAYELTGTAPNRVLTMQWLNWHEAGAGTAQFSMQVKLYETTNAVRFVYRQDAGSFLYGPQFSIGLAGPVASGATTFVSLNNAGTAPTASSTTETATISAKPATGQQYSFNFPASLATAAPALAAALALYPNPAQAEVQLSVPASLQAERLSATLLNALGQVVQTTTLPAGAARTLPLAGLAPGVYTLRLDTSAGTIAKRLLVE